MFVGREKFLDLGQRRPRSRIDEVGKPMIEKGGVRKGVGDGVVVVVESWKFEPKMALSANEGQRVVGTAKLSLHASRVTRKWGRESCSIRVSPGQCTLEISVQVNNTNLTWIYNLPFSLLIFPQPPSSCVVCCSLSQLSHHG